MKIISLEVLKKWLRYEPDTGDFYWLKSKQGISLHKPAGTTTNKGYTVICIEGERFLSHKLAWLYVYENYPDFELDHVNGNGLDNRISNLRRATHSQNLANAKLRRDNSSGSKGICWDYQKSKWKVQIGPAYNRIQRHFTDYAEAETFAREVSVSVFGAFARAV